MHAFAGLGGVAHGTFWSCSRGMRGRIITLHRSTCRHILRVRRQELVNVFKRQLRRILATPTRQRRSDGLRRFVARDVVAAKAAITTQRPAAHILKLSSSAFTGIVL